MPLLDIRNLTVWIDTPNGRVKAIDKVTLVMQDAEVHALIGESGSGKSILAQVVMGIAKKHWTVHADRLEFNKQNLLELNDKARRKLMGSEIAMIFQEPSSCLDPTSKLGPQILECMPEQAPKWQFLKNRKAKRQLARQWLHKVGIKDHNRVFNSYSWELTDGICQKVLIAMALAKKPRLLIADEPTSTMEVRTQGQIIRLLHKLNKTQGVSILLAGHDINALSHWADKFTVMYCGQALESGRTSVILGSPKNPYTHSLIKSSIEQEEHHYDILPGTIPSLEHLPIGCRLGPRCPNAQKGCIEVPITKVTKGHAWKCHHPMELS